MFVMFIMNEPNYAALYTNLASEDASKVVEHLASQKIPYKIEDNGQTIRVPKDKVYEIRLTLASKGIPSSGIVGYEIFDKTTMGMSEFMQKLNYKRALEGELSRTIMQQNGIAAARVHIVFPARSVFKDEQKEPTASVVLKFVSNSELSKSSVSAISNLVASSVEGLKPEKVTIVDSKGRLLSKENEENALGNFSEKQYQIKNNVENYLLSKAQTLLDNVLGFGNAVVRVNVDLDFNQVEKTMETYDPESQVAISEQSIKSESGGKNLSDSNSVASQNSITNYEVSKTIQKVVEGSGNIKRVTVAAVINGISKEVKDGEGVKKVVENRPDEQMKKLEQLVKQAVGFDINRNDQVSIVNMPFENQTELGTDEKGTSSFPLDKIYNLVLIVLAIGAAMFILKSLLQRLKNEKIVIGTINYRDEFGKELVQKEEIKAEAQQQQLSPAVKKNPLLEVGDIQDEISEEAINKQIKKEKIVNYVSRNPGEAAKLINLWLNEDEY